jgi:hypothetical protein
MALAHRVKKLESALRPPQTIQCMNVYYECDTEADIEARIARELRAGGG